MKNYVYRLLLLLTVLALAGCGEKKTEAVAGEAYKIYYLNTSVTKLAPYEYHTETTDTELLIQELMEQFLKVPNDVDSQAALSDKVGYRGYRLEERILYLYFDGGYSRVNMDATREILCRAALTKTMTQLEGVDYISINCEGQPLLDTHGNPVGAIAGSDFVDSISDVNSYEKVELTLYFANEEKDGLVAEKREVFHSMNTSLERLVVEQLLAGSQNGGLSVMPKNTKVLNVSLTDNTCYVNLDSSFISGDIDVAEYIPIYAIVDSLTELQTVFQKSREIAVNVQVKAPTAATVNVAVTVKTAEGTDFAKVKTAVEADLAEQFNGKLLGRGVKLAELNSRIYALPGVENCHITAPSADLAANDTVLPVLGTVTVTEEA